MSDYHEKCRKPFREFELQSRMSGRKRKLDFDVNLFLLPTTSVKRFSTSQSEIYQKNKPFPEKSGTSTRIKKEETKDLKRDYVNARKKREEFRKKLVELILITEDERSALSTPFPSEYEKQFLRYHYYIKHGADTTNISPINTEWLKNIIHLIPRRLRKNSSRLDALINDLKEDYLLTIKKSIIDFALQNSSDSLDATSQFTAQQHSIDADSNQIRRTFITSAGKLIHSLHTINPFMVDVLDLWYSKCSKLRLINVDALSSRKEPFTLEEFMLYLGTNISNVKNILEKEWLPSIRKLFLKEHYDGYIPKEKKKRALEHFFECVATLMSFQLQCLCLDSIEDFTSFTIDVKTRNPGFLIILNLKNKRIQFEPNFEKFNKAILDIYNKLISAVMLIPRIEYILYADKNKPLKYLAPEILEEYVKNRKDKVYLLLEDQRIGPELRIQDFDDYIDLINGEAEAEVTKFINGDHTFEEYKEFVLKLSQIYHDIPYKIEIRIEMGMYKVQREELMQSIMTAATKLKERLIAKLINDYQNMCKELGEAYQSINDKLLFPPSNTAELMALKACAEKVRNKTLGELEEVLRTIMSYILFLSDHVPLNPMEMKQNSVTFLLYMKMNDVFDQNQKLVERKTLDFQAYLKERIKEFLDNLDSWLAEVEELETLGDINELSNYLAKAVQLENIVIGAITTIEKFNEEERSFQWEETSYPKRKQIADKLAPFKTLYDNASEFLRKHEDWTKSQVGIHIPADIESETGTYFENIYKLEKFFIDLPEPRRLAQAVLEEIEAFKEHMPLVMTLGNPGLKERHWEMISEIVGFPIVLNEELTLAKIFEYGIEEYVVKFAAISDAATKENNLEKALSKMVNEWVDMEFSVLEYRDSGTYIISGVDEIQLLLDDHIVKSQTMKNSPYIKPFEQQILSWETKLILLQEIMDEWLKVQVTWLNLEPIFTSPDIQMEMPEEGRKFSAVDKIWRDIMKTVSADAHVMVVVDVDKMLDRLKKCNTLLEVIQRGLNDYLEKKRLYFPRFFFLSNDELLEILSETKDPTRVQPHLKKCFEGIAKLNFTQDLDINKIISSESEMVDLVDVISTSVARGQVEKWLLLLEAVMKESIQKIIADAMTAYPMKEHHCWIFDWPGQSILAVSSIFWTAEMHNAISNRSVANFRNQWNFQVEKIVSLVHGPLDTRMRITLGALITIDVHLRDVIASLENNNIVRQDDFHWLCHLRYYWEENNLQASMINSSLMYGYEYLGNSSRLVITPLTDRCYRTLFSALYFHLGGILEGPSGSGKTETVKDISKAIAKQCVVFNCSNGLDYICLAKFFKGFAACGAWFCFDEFNRIDVDVLSVAAHQMLTVQLGKVASKPNLLFEGIELKFNPSCAVFLTLNPGYVGRFDLPDNLKAQFRPVAMIVPEFSVISEITLYSYGFLSSHTLAVKIVETCRLCFELLSSQNHYDFGLRAIKSILNAAAKFKVQYKEEEEVIIVLRSIKYVHLPKFISHDLPIFHGIIVDLFPGIHLPAPDYSVLNKSVREACTKANIQCTDYFLGKIQQIYDTMRVRHGFMIIGLPFSGKTCAYMMLAGALELMEETGELSEHRVEITVINPKSITMGQLYGQFDDVSHEWSDGVLAVSFRLFSMSTNRNRKWLIFDGPVDTVWIENMNTVLDDNRKLCLMSGEIIKLQSSMNVVFEPMDLEVASPATVSRCGMIYMEPSELGWECLLNSWINTLPSIFDIQIIEVIKELYLRFIRVFLYCFHRSGILKAIFPSSDSNMVKAVMNLFDCFMDEFCDQKHAEILSELDTRAQVEGVFFFCCIWGIGGTLDSRSRETFTLLFHALVQKSFPDDVKKDYELPDELIKPPKKNYIFLPPTFGTLFHYRYIREGKGKWKPWVDELALAPAIPRDIPVNQIIVTTLETIRCMALMNLLVLHEKHVLFIGPTGTGKSVNIVNYLLKKVDAEIYRPHFINFSAQTSANQIQDIIMSKLDKRRKGVYGPPLGKKAVVFVDDLSMPMKETYGAQPPIELLRQWLDHWMWYDRKDNSAIKLVDIQLMSAMAPPSDGKPVSPRFWRHFNITVINEFDDETMVMIFSKIMLWHLDTRGFSKEFDPCIEQIVGATLSIYKLVLHNLLPTPTKSHYLFNLRDFSRVIQGVLLSVPEAMEDLRAMKKLWIHEVLRVCGDRLVDEIDKNWLIATLHSICRENLFEDMNELLQHLRSNTDDEIGDIELRKLMYCDFANPKADQRNYIEVLDFTTLQEILEGYLNEFNNMSKKPMNLIMFRFAVEHLSRICRILKQPRGHALLVGVGGSGKQSLTRLAAHISEYDLFQVEITKQYGVHDWHEDIKTILKKSCASDQHVVFLFTDSQIKEESFVEDISNLLNSGEVPNIFNNDERSDLYEKIRTIDRQKEKTQQTDGSPGALFNLFLQIVREQLHIVLAFCPIGDGFKTWMRKFPVMGWPDDALLAVATHFLSIIELTEPEKKSCISMCQHFHRSTQSLAKSFFLKTGCCIYVTPTSYLDLITTFKSLQKKKRNDVLVGKQRYMIGLEKLVHASSQIEVMGENLKELQPALIQATDDVRNTAIKLDKEKDELGKIEEIVRENESLVQSLTDAAQVIKDECDKHLAEVIPNLEDAILTLNNIKPCDLTLVKNIKNPPKGIKLVMEAVCIMKDIKPDRIPDSEGTGKMVEDFWGPSKRILGDIKFLENLVNYDKENIPPRIIKIITENFVSLPDFDPEKIKSASAPPEGLCKWVIAISNYDKVAKVIAPKNISLAKAEEELQAAANILEVKYAQRRELQLKVVNLETTLDAQKNKLTTLQADSDLCSLKLQRAQELLGGLGGEQTRWQQAAEALEERLGSLTGDILVASGVVAYLGPFTEPFRVKQITEWIDRTQSLNIICSGDFSVTKTFGEPVEIRHWKICGLPNDTLSVENAVIARNSQRFPLMIDPQGQGNKWIKSLEKSNGLKVIRVTQSDYLRILENSVQSGTPVLLESIGEELDTLLEPLLLKQLFKAGGVMCVKIGDAVVEFSQSFRFYITTKLRNPHYLPDVAVKVTLINFTVTPSGLESELLAIVTAKERPDLEAERNQLIVTGAQNKRILKETEDKILEILSSSGNNILEDECAVNALSSSKALANEIAQKQEVAEVTERSIDATRKHYEPVGSYATVLFFSISNLICIDPMYQFSLPWFISILKTSIDNTEKNDDLLKRIEGISKSFTYSLFVKVSRSLFEKDKLAFSLLIAINLMFKRNAINEDEWKFLITGGVGGPNLHPNPTKWLPTSSWDDLCRLSDLPSFNGLSEHLSKNEKLWKEMFDSQEPKPLNLPLPWNENLTQFQKLLILRCIRSDKIIPAIQSLVEVELGNPFLEPPLLDLSAVFVDSHCCVPLIIILTPMADPTTTFLKFADEMLLCLQKLLEELFNFPLSDKASLIGKLFTASILLYFFSNGLSMIPLNRYYEGFGENRVRLLSLGQGQGAVATRMITEALQAGTWVLLQNCHLAKCWMPILEKICEDFAPESTHPDFRLWLTSYSTYDFPDLVLQNGVKMTYEPPKGLRSNLTKSLLSDPITAADFFEGCKKSIPFKRLLFTLCFFHALVQERKTFGSLGWNILYDFNETDLRISIQHLKIFLNQYDHVQFEALCFLFGDCYYGGRISDEWDKRTIKTILGKMYCPALLDTEQVYNFDSSGVYYCPNVTEYQDFLDYTKSLPLITKPSVFGMNEIADTKDKSETEVLFSTILLTQYERIGSNEVEPQDEVVTTLIEEILTKLPRNFDLICSSKKYSPSYNESMNTVRLQEMERYNILLTIVRNSLTNLSKAIKGEIVMSLNLEDLFSSVANSKVPDMWIKQSYVSLKPLGSYISDLIARIKFLQEWLENGPPPAFWLSGFFSPQAFLSAVLQNFSRKFNISIDLLTFDFQIKTGELDAEDHKNGVNMYGLFLEGARWNISTQLLDECLEKVSCSSMPMILFQPALKTDVVVGARYTTPLYRTSERRGVVSTSGHSNNFVITIFLPTEKPESHWVLRGVALLCQLST